MKLKFIALPLIALTFGWITNVKAQDEATEDNFWSETTANDSLDSETKAEKDNREGATAKVKPVENSCSNRNELREEVRLLIKPFRYNLAKTTTINYKRYPQKLRVLVPIYSNQEHRVVFSTKGLPQDILISIYDGPVSDKKRKVLFNSTKGEPINLFELPKDYKESYLFVEYDVPASDAEDRSTVRKGCVVMMMGYLFLPETEEEGTVTTK